MTNVYLKNNVIVDVASLNDIAAEALKSGTADQIIVVKNKEDFGQIILKHGCSNAAVWEHCFNIYNNWDQVIHQHIEDFTNPDVFKEVAEEVGLLIEDVKAKLQEVGKNLPDINDISKGFEDLKNNAIVQVGKIGTQLSDFFGQFKGK